MKSISNAGEETLICPANGRIFTIKLLSYCIKGEIS